jgi:hypothetical protein
MIILEKKQIGKGGKCRETIIFQPKKELTKGEKYFCKIGNMPVVISEDGIEVHMSEPDFRVTFGEFERKKEIGRD